MRPFHQQIISLLAVFALPTWGQQFEGVVRGVEYPGLSDTCLDALNTTVPNCPALLASVSVDNPRLNTDQLMALCTADCRAALTSSLKTIAAHCGSPSDTIELSDGVVYPATFFIRRFIYTYDLSCRRDKASGQYCDELFFSWLAADNASTSAANCSDCSLGVMQIQLNSPFGYDDDFAEEFKSATASCSSADYSFTSPSSYAIRTDLPSPGNDLSTPSCSSPYLVPPGDSCDAISLSKGVSTYSIIRAGGLRPDCSNLAAGASLCLPSPCSLYRVQEGDDCASIVARYPGVTRESLLSWNPNISPICTNIAGLVGTLICLTPPGGNASDVTITVAPPAATTAAPTAVPKPTNSHPNTTAPCAGWYTVQDGDYCESISIRQNIALHDFYFLNPSIDANCTNLWLNTAYCVRAVGDINTYPGYPYSTSPLYTLASSSFVTTTTTLSRTVPSVTPIVSLPLAPGTKSDCEAYVEHMPVDPYRDQSQSEDGRLVTARMNSCVFASSGYPVLLDDFLSWNPSLASLSPCYLQPGYSYCALNSSSVVVPNPPDGRCLDVAAAYPGTIPTCSCFTTVMGADATYTTCAQVAQDAGISVADVAAWNPWIMIGSNCEAGLFAGLSGTQERAVCIGVSSAGGIIASRTTASTSTTASTATSPPTTPPAPTQTGIVASCTRYYVAQLGDGCRAIAHQFGITLDQFLAWNPAVGSNCEHLWPNYAYCVAAL